MRRRWLHGGVDVDAGCAPNGRSTWLAASKPSGGVDVDASERDPTQPCDDGLDNDGDYGIDVAGDSGCIKPTSNREDPQCSDGIDNDGDGTVDWDGAGYADADAYCQGLAAKLRERPPKKNCGVGLELALALPVMWWLRRRTGRAPRT